MALFVPVALAAFSLFPASGTSYSEGSAGAFGGSAGATRSGLLARGLFEEVPALAPGTADQSAATTLPRSAFLAAALDDFGTAPDFPPTRGNLFTYRVGKGDTLSRIAAKFGTSVAAIARTNPAVSARRLQPGMTLTILPIAGTVYVTKDGDDLETIADAFGVPMASIAAVNRSVDFGALAPGVTLVIPGARVAESFSSGNSLPVLKNYFLMPTSGYNWGQLRPKNGVDISASCGAPVVAAAEGLVIPDEAYGDGNGGWNGGYGSFVLIEHPAGASVRTRYAHLGKVEVGIGDYVKQGQEIGAVGDTGNANGCRLEFEVYGAANPFAK